MVSIAFLVLSKSAIDNHDLFTDIIHPSVENTEKIEFPSQTDKIMAAVVYHQIPVFFTRTNGFVSISSSDFDNADYFNK